MKNILRFLSQLKNNSGFSLAEVMISAGILGIISMGIMEITKMQSKSSKRANIDLEINQITYEIQNLMRDPESCKVSLARDPLAVNAGYTNWKAYPISPRTPFTNIYRVDGAGTTVAGVPYTAGLPAYTIGAQRNVRIVSLRAYPHANAGTTAPATAEPKPYVISVTYGIKDSIGTYGVAAMNGTQRELQVTKLIDTTAIVGPGWVVSNCSLDPLSEAQKYCDLFEGTVQQDGAGMLRCRQTQVRSTLTGTVASRFSNNIDVGGQLLVGANTIAKGNITMDGTTLSATQAQTVSLGTMNATVAPTVNIGGTVGNPTVNIGSAANGNLNVRNLVDTTMNLGTTAGGATLNFMGAGGTRPQIVGAAAGNLTVSSPLTTNINGSVAANMTGGTVSVNGTTSAIIGIVGKTLTINTATTAAIFNVPVISRAPSLGSASLNSDGGYLVNKQWVYDALTGVAGDLFDPDRINTLIDYLLNRAHQGGETGAYRTLRAAILNHLVTSALTPCGTNEALSSFSTETPLNGWRHNQTCLKIPGSGTGAADCGAGSALQSLNWNSSTGAWVKVCTLLPPDCTQTGKCSQLCIGNVCQTSWGHVSCPQGQFVKAWTKAGAVCSKIGPEIKVPAALSGNYMFWDTLKATDQNAWDGGVRLQDAIRDWTQAFWTSNQ